MLPLLLLTIQNILVQRIISFEIARGVGRRHFGNFELAVKRQIVPNAIIVCSEGIDAAAMIHRSCRGGRSRQIVHVRERI